MTPSSDIGLWQITLGARGPLVESHLQNNILHNFVESQNNILATEICLRGPVKGVVTNNGWYSKETHFWFENSSVRQGNFESKKVTKITVTVRHPERSSLKTRQCHYFVCGYRPVKLHGVVYSVNSNLLHFAFGDLDEDRYIQSASTNNSLSTNLSVLSHDWWNIVITVIVLISIVLIWCGRSVLNKEWVSITNIQVIYEC